MDKKNFAKIHSIETFGTVDGPGIRFVTFFQGCNLECKYCHNRDTWNINEGNYISVDELFDNILKYKSYIMPNGGFTASGGEPLLQASFILDVLELGAKNWHTTIETSLNVPYDKWYSLIDYVNEWIIDIKDMNPSIYKCYTGNDNAIVIDNLKKFVDLGLADRVLIRLPLIKGFNTEADVRNSYQKLEQIGFSRFDKFSYKIVK